MRPPIRVLVIFLSIYLLLAMGLLPVGSARDELLYTLPLWGIVTVGAYCLGTLGIGLMTFGDCTPAYEELLRQITEARNDLRAKGVRVD